MYCQHCHYDLQQLAQDLCPECGTKFDRNQPESYLQAVPTRRVYLIGQVLFINIAAAAVILISIKTDTNILLAAGFSAVSMSGLLCAVDAKRNKKKTVVAGAWGGLATACLLTLFLHATFLVGYFFHSGKRSYFEDDPVGMIFIFPIILVMIYGAIGLLVGCVIGLIVSCLPWRT